MSGLRLLGSCSSGSPEQHLAGAAGWGGREKASGSVRGDMSVPEGVEQIDAVARVTGMPRPSCRRRGGCTEASVLVAGRRVRAREPRLAARQWASTESGAGRRRLAVTPRAGVRNLTTSRRPRPHLPARQAHRPPAASPPWPTLCGLLAQAGKLPSEAPCRRCRRRRPSVTRSRATAGLVDAAPRVVERADLLVDPAYRGRAAGSGQEDAGFCLGSSAVTRASEACPGLLEGAGAEPRR